MAGVSDYFGIDLILIVDVGVQNFMKDLFKFSNYRNQLLFNN